MIALALSASCSIKAEQLSVRVEDQKGRLLENAVVLVESPLLLAGVAPMVQAEVAQQNKSFSPQVLVVTRGTEVEFPNRDTVRHHVYSFSEAKTFELKLYIGKPEAPVLFDRPGVVELGCNIHDSMLGWVLVTDTPVYKQTSANGIALFDNLPADSYTIRAWHPDLPYGVAPVEQSLVINDADASATITLETI